MAKKKVKTQGVAANVITFSSAWPFERKCPECGKVFAGSCEMERWPYRDGYTLLCSWGCVRRREKRKEEAELRVLEKRRRKRLTKAQKTALIRQKIFIGMSNEEISLDMGISEQIVNCYRKKIEEEYDVCEYSGERGERGV